MKIIFLIVSLSALWVTETRRVRSNKVECGSSSKSSSKVYCYLKAYDRKNPLVNGGYTMIRPSPNSSTFVGIYRKSGYNYDSIMTLPDLPLCKLFRESKTAMLFSPFIQLIVKSLKENLGNYFESCEKAGDYKLRNMSAQDMPMLAQWPKGQYKLELRLHDKVDDNIVNTTLFMTILN